MESNTVAQYCYYEYGKKLVEYSAVLKIPQEGDAAGDQSETKLIYLPYLSYVKGVDNGEPTSSATHPDNVYLFKAPTEVYTYASISDGIAG